MNCSRPVEKPEEGDDTIIEPIVDPIVEPKWLETESEEAACTLGSKRMGAMLCWPKCSDDVPLEVRQNSSSGNSWCASMGKTGAAPLKKEASSGEARS